SRRPTCSSSTRCRSSREDDGAPIAPRLPASGLVSYRGPQAQACRRRIVGPGDLMAFFDIPRPEELTPEVRRWFDELKRLRGVEAPPSSTLVYGRSPKIVEARVKAEANLVPKSGPSGFSFSTRQIAFMLIAHARRCQGCFGAARTQLTALGFD